MKHQHMRTARTPIQLAAALTFGISLLVGCDNAPPSNASHEGGSGGTSTGRGGAGTSSGSGTASGGNASVASGSGTIDLGGSGNSCDVRPVAQCASGNDGSIEEKCFTLEELSDPCSGTHLLSVHMGEGGGAGAEAGPAVVGDGGTDECPSANELFWGDVGDRCGCFDEPACTTPTVQKGSKCCYRLRTSCRLC